MTLAIFEFGAVDPVTGDPIYPPSLVTRGVALDTNHTCLKTTRLVEVVSSSDVRVAVGSTPTAGDQFLEAGDIARFRLPERQGVATTIHATASAPVAAAQYQLPTAIATVGAGTLTAAALLGGVIVRSGSTAAFTDTTDTAELIQAEWTGHVGSSFAFSIRNTTNFAETLAAGTGVTLSGPVIVPPNSSGYFLAVWTGVNTITITTRFIVSNAPQPATTALTTNGAGTITAAGIVGGVTLRSVPTVAFTDTTDTAANIIAAMPNAAIGQSFFYRYRNNSGVAATLTGGVGVTVSGITIVPGNTWATFLVTYTAAATVTMVGVAMAENAPQPAALLTALNATTGSLAAGLITGADTVTMISSNATPGAQLVRTAAQMLADIPNGQVGMSWNIRIVNTGAGTLTLTADGGGTVTLTGTMTVPQNTFRDFVATITAATTATITATATGTYS